MSIVDYIRQIRLERAQYWLTYTDKSIEGTSDAPAGELERLGISIGTYLDNNDAYHALQAVDSLIITGPTGTNVNDLSLVLIDGK